jgi:hypothetical protein
MGIVAKQWSQIDTCKFEVGNSLNIVLHFLHVLIRLFLKFEKVQPIRLLVFILITKYLNQNLQLNTHSSS